jgi:heat shock protein HslJ
VSLGALLLAVACGEQGGGSVTGADDVVELDGRTLVVTGVTESGRPRPVAPGTQVRLSFADGRLGISAGCNSMSGDYRLDGDRLTVGPIAGTEMGCPEELMAQDAWLAGLFAEPVVVGADPLTLTAGEVVLALADREDAAPDAPLVGTTWRLDSLVTGDSVSSVPAGVSATLVMEEDGQVRLDTGCNTGGGRVEARGETLRWGPLMTTRKACLGAEGDVERHVVSVLAGDTTYEIVEDSLTITRGADGVGYRAG